MASSHLPTHDFFRKVNWPEARLSSMTETPPSPPPRSLLEPDRGRVLIDPPPHPLARDLPSPPRLRLGSATMAGGTLARAIASREHSHLNTGLLDLMTDELSG